VLLLRVPDRRISHGRGISDWTSGGGLCLRDMVLVPLVVRRGEEGRVLQPTLGEYISICGGGFIFLRGSGCRTASAQGDG